MAGPEAPSELAPLVARPGRAGIFTDFDGTLAAIVADPWEARPLPGAADALARLARRYKRVAVVSGRPAAFLDEHFGGRGVLLSGLYGLEAAGPGGVVVDPAAARWRAVVEEAASRAESHGPDGMFVERKGLSVTFHYRTDPALHPAVRSWAEAETARTGLELHPARMSYELRPPVGRSKGSVVEELADGLDAVCFVGDDRGDLDAFDAMDRLAAAGRTAVRVGVRSEEAPAELLTRADVLVDGPGGVLALLEEL